MIKDRTPEAPKTTRDRTMRIVRKDGSLVDPAWTHDLQMLCEIADQAPFMIWMADKKGGVFYLNPAWSEFTGQQRDAGLGDGWLEMVHQDERERTYSAFYSAWSRQVEFHAEYRLHQSSAHGHRWVSASGRPLINPDGSCGGYLGTVYAHAVRDATPAGTRLSPRETEVLQLAAIGKTSDEIAIILSISARTVEAHINSILLKTNSVNKVQAVVSAIKSGQIIV
jgi:PAS domain S-box-containing protein